MNRDYPELLKSKGVSLEEIGLHEFGLRRADALDAIQVLKNKVAILGGDVYFWKENRVSPAYANWCVERFDDESTEEFIGRSYQVAERYIREFPEEHEFLALFVLVPEI